MRELLLFLPIVLFLFLLLLTSIWLENRKTTEKSLEDFYLEHVRRHSSAHTPLIPGQDGRGEGAQ